jgi:hypothetical protein
MKIICALLLTTVLTTFAVASEIIKAKVISVKTYERGRIVYWEGGTPIYDDRAVYDITIAVGEKAYIVRYYSTTSFYPRTWKAGNEINVKQERGAFVLLNGEEEVTARTVSEQDCNPNSTRPTGVVSMSRLPCQ